MCRDIRTMYVSDQTGNVSGEYRPGTPELPVSGDPRTDIRPRTDPRTSSVSVPSHLNRGRELVGGLRSGLPQSRGFVLGPLRRSSVVPNLPNLIGDTETRRTRSLHYYES